MHIERPDAAVRWRPFFSLEAPSSASRSRPRYSSEMARGLLPQSPDPLKHKADFESRIEMLIENRISSTSMIEKERDTDKEVKAGSPGRPSTALETFKRLAIGYIRVSTRLQDGDLDSQAQLLKTGAAQRNLELVEIYDDVASGVGNEALKDRPGLGDALKRAKSLDAPLLVTDRTRISRTDGVAERLSREHEVSVICIDTDLMPTASAPRSSAERFARKVRERTSQSLGGATLGRARSFNPNLPAARRRASIANRMRFDAIVEELVEFLRREDPMLRLTARQIVEKLNLAGKTASRGGAWTLPAIRRPLRAAKQLMEFEKELDRDPYAGSGLTDPGHPED